MKPTPKNIAASTLFAGCCAGMSMAAHAQSTVTLYGILDAGITWASNEGGHSVPFLDTGVMQGNRLGFKGVEDLGGGMKAIFDLENGYQLQNGKLGQGGALFGRQAWVGLSGDRWGVLTAGHQYDFMCDTLETYYTPTWSAGGYANNPLDNDRMSGQRVDNSVKYMSPDLAGFKLGAMYGFSNLAGNINGNGRTYSFTGVYARGNFSAGVAYTEISGATLDISPLVGSATPVNVGGSKLRTWGAGADYQFSQVTVYGVYSQAQYESANGLPSAMFRNYQGGFNYTHNVAQIYGIGYGLTTLGANRYHQLNLTFDYLLSKRTDVYVQSIIMHATGESATAAIISIPASSNGNQVLLRLGMRHKF
ncbi:porin [Paraburkholderia sp. D1E]|uniref:porin n=1 Tax=Paraburkholderia sp. D1E TaxID=3461398 RepID=UPI004045ED8D